MTALLTFAMSNPWRSAAIGLAVLLALGWGTYRIKEMIWTGKVERAEAALLVCETNVGTLTTALDRQNEAVQDLQAEAIARQAEDTKRATEARERSAKSRQREMGDDRSGHEFMNAWMAGAFQ